MAFNYAHYGRILAGSALLMGLSILVARADGDDAGLKYSVGKAKWKSECGACHIAYPPGLLPAQSWRAIMSRLDRHFGSNAGLDTETAKEITEFLERNADTRRQSLADKAKVRITETRWFRAEHKDVAARTWKSDRVKSRANCGACHRNAEAGDFGKATLMLP